MQETIIKKSDIKVKLAKLDQNNTDIPAGYKEVLAYDEYIVIKIHADEKRNGIDTLILDLVNLPFTSFITRLDKNQGLMKIYSTNGNLNKIYQRRINFYKILVEKRAEEQQKVEEVVDNEEQK